MARGVAGPPSLLADPRAGQRSHAHRCRDADEWSATHPQAHDGFVHFLKSSELPVDLRARKLGLIENDQARVVVGPAYCDERSRGTGHVCARVHRGLRYHRLCRARCWGIVIPIDLTQSAIHARKGFVRLLGVGHFLWLPMLPWLWTRLAETPSGLFRNWILAVLVVDGISVVIDVTDVTRYFLGDRDLPVVPE